MICILNPCINKINLYFCPEGIPLLDAGCDVMVSNLSSQQHYVECLLQYGILKILKTLNC